MKKNGSGLLKKGFGQGGWLLVALLLSALAGHPAQATHIVGGQLGMKYVNVGTYDLTMSLYFDAVNGSAGARDRSVLVGIYERGTQTRLDTIRLPLTGSLPVAYSQPLCAQPQQLSTEELFYRRRVQLNPAAYASPRGYYMIWERCCRNNIITNINAPDSAGTAFYLAFPAVRSGGQPVVNSSPTGFRPIGDYACLNTEFRVAFGGTDPDGDALRYALVTPLNGHSMSGNPAPVPRGGPYSRIQWRPGYDSTQAIPGPMPLTIDPQTGELRLKASQQGLFVFAVRCQELRAGVVIGEVWREFQLRVLNCPTNQVSTFTLNLPTATGGIRPYTPGDTLVLPPASPSATRCFELVATDSSDVLTMQLTAAPGTPAGPLPTLSSLGGNVGPNAQLRASLCFPACYGADGQTRTFQLLLTDRACPVPHRTTITLVVRVPLVPDTPPALSTTASPAGYTVQVGDTVAFDFTGRDPDPGATVRVQLANLNSGPLRGYNIGCPPRTAPATATTRLLWVIGCEVLPGDYALRLQTTGTDSCGRAAATDSLVLVRVVPPPDVPPTLVVANAPAPEFRVQEGDSVVFSFSGRDTDPNTTVLVQATNLNTGPLAGLPIGCPPQQGPNLATTTLRWLIGCQPDSGLYNLNLQMQATSCGLIRQVDTTVRVRVVRRPDTRPTLTVTPNTAAFSLRVGQLLQFDFTARDPDPDTRVLVRAGNLQTADLRTQAITCPVVTGLNEATTTLQWPVACDVRPGRYPLVLETVTEHCGRLLTTDSTVWVQVLPADSTRLLPPNIFTPNADGYNDAFQPAAGVLPGCGQAFRQVRLFNRWGREIWHSPDRFATWTGAGAGEGMYFYLLEYTDRSYKGWVELVR